MAQILVVDDDRHLREVVRFALEKAGFSVREADSGEAALLAYREATPDAVILDIVLPGEDGLSVCRKLRILGEVPILFLSSRDEELDRVLGLELGADDYVTKPFSPRELTARVKALLRRVKAPTPAEEEERLALGPLVLDRARHRCTFGEAEVPLTATEFNLLAALLKRPGRVFSRDELVDRVWGVGHALTDRTVDSHIRRVRAKLAAVGVDPVETVLGVGYRLVERL